MENEMAVAHTILQHLGGNRFIIMTGARNLIGSPNALSFRFPKARNGVTGAHVTLSADDTYEMTFYRIAKSAASVISQRAGVYCDQLASTFTSETGLAVSL
jgi:hypothetical protein